MLAGKLVKISDKQWKFYNRKMNSVLIDWNNIPDVWHDQAITYENDTQGRLFSITCNGKTITNPNVRQGTTIHAGSLIKDQIRKSEYAQQVEKRKSNKPGLRSEQRLSSEPRSNNASNAPYNFVPLNERPLDSPEPETDLSKFTGISGYIDLEITALTHLFIKGTGYDFFKVGKKYGIPGSSIRGMIRNLVEILSYGKFELLNDKYISYRITGQASDRFFGFLTFDSQSNEYYVTAGHKPSAISFTNQFKYELNSSGELEIHTKGVGKNHKFFIVKYATNGSKAIPVAEMAIKSYKDDTQRNADGSMKDLIQLVQDHKNIIIKKCRDLNLKYIGIPVFYKLSDSGAEVISFGHCKNYRVPYANSVADAVHEKLRENEVIDIASSLFGYTTKEENKTTLTPGKVFFEDAVVSNETKTTVAILQILASPKPKSGKLYLEPKSNGDTGTWSDKPVIRGYKLFHHRDTNGFQDTPTDSLKTEQVNWQKTRFSDNHFKNLSLNNTEETAFKKEEKQDDRRNVFHFTKKLSLPEVSQHLKEKIADKTNNGDKSQFKTVNALPPGTHFTRARIRFEHLTEIELGALLLAVNLKEDCRHKIGMGKPIGMGSIHITSTLTIINRKERYQKLFSDKNMTSWHTGASPDNQDTYINAFTKYICNQLGKEEDFWALDRMRELYALLRFDPDVIKNEDFLRATNYMHLDDFKSRGNLPKASKVANQYFSDKPS